MSDDIAAAPVADTAIAGGEVAADGAAPAPAGVSGEQQSSEAGQGAPAGDGQGAGNETPPAGGASADGEAAAGAEGGAAQGAPEQYAAFTVPDGYELTGTMLEGVQTFAKAHNLDQAQAQALVDLGLTQADEIAARFASEAQEAPVPLSAHWASEWSKQTASDPAYGGEKLKTTMALVTRVFNTFGTPELGEFLNDTGMAHHPELVRFMHAVGQAVSEDTLVTSQGGTSKTPTGRDPARKLYPSMN